MALSAQQILKRYQDAMASGQTKQRYIDGVNATTVNPMELAASAASQQLFLDRVTDSVTSGRRANALLSVPVSRWKQNAAGKGSARLQSGAQGASDKMMQTLQYWAPIYQQASDAANALPKGDLDAGMARCRAAAAVMKQAAGKM